MPQDFPSTPFAADGPLPSASPSPTFFATRRGQVAGYLVFVASLVLAAVVQGPAGLTANYAVLVGFLLTLATLSASVFFVHLVVLITNERLSLVSRRLFVIGYWAALGSCTLFPYLYASVWFSGQALISMLASFQLAAIALYALGLYRVTRELDLAAPRLSSAAWWLARIPVILIVLQLTLGGLGLILAAVGYLIVLEVARRIKRRAQANAFALAVDP